MIVHAWLAAVQNGAVTPAPASTPAPAPPTLGAHTVTNYPLGGAGNLPTLSTRPINTQTIGSLLLVSIGKGRISEITAPTDNKGNSSVQLGAPQSYYPQYPASGTGIFAFSQPTGGIGHIITTTNETARDEVTMSVVEIKNGGKVQDFQWNKVEREDPLTSRNVTTTGPATLIAFWWGDGNESVAHKAVPRNGFQLIDSVLSMGALVQAAVATKDVATAGTYNVTWDSAGQEGAQLWLVAVQSSVPQAPPSPGERN